MPEYSPNLNIEKALGTENVNRAYFMRVIDDIDDKVGVANGLAKLDANGNVLKADGTQAGEVTKAQFDTHTGQAATTLKVGHVQLSDAVTSTDVTKAATSNAVKKAYDRADAAFTSASNGKTAIKDAVTGADPRVVVPTDPTFAQLATAVGQIKTGKKWAQGNKSVVVDRHQYYYWLNGFSVSNLDFTPSIILVSGSDGKFIVNAGALMHWDTGSIVIVHFSTNSSQDVKHINGGKITISDKSFSVAGVEDAPGYFVGTDMLNYTNKLLHWIAFE